MKKCHCIGLLWELQEPTVVTGAAQPPAPCPRERSLPPPAPGSAALGPAARCLVFVFHCWQIMGRRIATENKSLTLVPFQI